MSLQFNLLGSLSIETDGGPSDLLKGPKGCALVAYLIVTRQAHTREFLADLLWEATTTAQALHNLRALLNRIRDLVPELQITRTILVFQPLAETTVDFLSLQAVLDQDLAQIDLSQLDSALQWYRGDLLAKFYLEGAPRFEEWLALERERLRQKVHAAYQWLCKTYLDREQWTEGLALAQRWLSLDPLNEEAVRACMQSLAARGEPGAGLQRYETFRQQLWRQFEFDPEPATATLAARLTELLEEQRQGTAWKHINMPICLNLARCRPIPSCPTPGTPISPVGKPTCWPWQRASFSREKLPRHPPPPSQAWAGWAKPNWRSSLPTATGITFPAGCTGCALPTRTMSHLKSL
jgi:DNA-binding SARP family transcriptional activator